MEKKKWINVVDKRTYLYLLLVPLGIVFAVLGLNNKDMTFGIAAFLCIFLGIYLFIKDNTYSEWMNPNHPH